MDEIKYKCVICGENLSENNMLEKYGKGNYKVYECSNGHLNDWWVLVDMDVGASLEQVIRAGFLDSIYTKEKIDYDDYIKEIQNRYPNEDWDEKTIRKSLNTCFNKFLQSKNISANREPLSLPPGESYDAIIISSRNSIVNFLNNRVVTPWTIKFLKTDYEKLKNEIKKNEKNIKYPDRWLAAIDYFKLKRE